MKSKDFCYWLAGILAHKKTLCKKDISLVQEKLTKVLRSERNLEIESMAPSVEFTYTEALPCYDGLSDAMKITSLPEDTSIKFEPRD